MPWILIAGVVYAIASLITGVLYWRDKRAAQRGSRRVPEHTLHLAEFCGGWPGALLARRVLRHKTRKRSYRIVFWLIVASHALAWAAVVWILSQGADD